MTPWPKSKDALRDPRVTLDLLNNVRANEVRQARGVRAALEWERRQRKLRKAMQP